MKYLNLAAALLFFSAHSASAADWITIYSSSAKGSATSDYSTQVVNGQNTLVYNVSDEQLKTACNDAVASANSTYNASISSFKNVYPSDEWRLSTGQQSITGNIANSPKLFTATCTVPFSIDHRATSQETKPDEQDPGAICAAKPVINNTFNNVYFGDGKDGYIWYQGCEYVTTGIIFCAPNDPTVCQADWKPTGQIPHEGDVESTPSTLPTDNGSGSGQTGEGDSGSSGGSTGGSGSGSGGSSGGSGSTISKSDMTAAVNDGVRSAAPVVANSVRDSLTENDTSADDKANADATTDTNISQLKSNMNNLARGAGRFADPDGAGKALGEGHSEMDTSVAIADSQLNISATSHGASWEPFLNSNGLLPNIPSGHGCTPIVFFPDTVMQMVLACDKLNDIKNILSWIVYITTFFFVFNELTGLLRSKK